MNTSWHEPVTRFGLIVRTLGRNLLRRKLEPEVALLGRFVPADGVCLDVGAAEGRYTLILSRLARRGRVYSFEPGTYHRRTLSTMTRLYRLHNVVIVADALGERPGPAVFRIPVKEGGNRGYGLGHLGAGAGEPGRFVEESVNVTTMDAMCRERGMDRVDFIKCDVEGAELLVFKGGLETLRRYRPAVLCELFPPYLERLGATAEDVRDLFTALGYRMYSLHDGLKMIERPDGSYNYFFLHPDRFPVSAGIPSGNAG